MEASTAAGPVLEVEIDRHVARVRLARPERRNALNEELIHEIALGLRSLEELEAVNIVVITGKGSCFSTGGDLGRARELFQLAPVELRGVMNSDFALIGSILQTIKRSPKTYIAQVNGPAYAAGFVLAMACDLIVASTDAAFSLPQVLAGAVDPFSPVLLQSLVGAPKARELLLVAEVLTAEEADALGFLHALVDPEMLDARVQQLIDKLSLAGPVARGAAKRLMNECDPVFDVLTAAHHYGSAETREAFQAFMDRRPPNWASLAGHKSQ